MADILSSVVSVVNLPQLSTAERQKTLIFSVSKVLNALVAELPTPIAEMTRKPAGLTEESSRNLQERLQACLRAPLPFLTPDEEDLIVQLVVAFVSAAMRDGLSLREILECDTAEKIVISEMVAVLHKNLSDPEKRATVLRKACQNSNSALPHWLLEQIISPALPEILQCIKVSVQESHKLHIKHRFTTTVVAPCAKDKREHGGSEGGGGGDASSQPLAAAITYGLAAAALTMVFQTWAGSSVQVPVPDEHVALFLGVAAGSHAFSHAYSKGQEVKTSAKGQEVKTSAKGQAARADEKAAKKSLGQEFQGLKSVGKAGKFAEGHSGLKRKKGGKGKGEAEKAEEEANAKEEEPTTEPNYPRTHASKPWRWGLGCAFTENTGEEQWGRQVEDTQEDQQEGEQEDVQVSEREGGSNLFDAKFSSPTTGFAENVRVRLAARLAGLDESLDEPLDEALDEALDAPLDVLPSLLYLVPASSHGISLWLADMALAGFEVEDVIGQRVAAFDRAAGHELVE
jgi:hypothetical protein